MTGIALLSAALLLAGESATPGPAPQAQPHEHQAAGPHRPDTASDARCCCEEMMHKMMMEMMQKHQGMGMAQPANAEKPEEHKH